MKEMTHFYLAGRTFILLIAAVTKMSLTFKSKKQVTKAISRPDFVIK